MGHSDSQQTDAAAALNEDVDRYGPLVDELADLLPVEGVSPTIREIAAEMIGRYVRDAKN